MKKDALFGWRANLEEASRQTQAHVKAQIDGVERILALETRSRVLDLCCGAGRRTLELARRGHRVLGVDPDEEALARARAAAKGERLNVHFMKADPREISYRAELDAVFFLDGAFGRLPTDRDDLRALECARKALKPGGSLLIDTLNKEWLMRHFEPNEQFSFDFEKGRLSDRRASSPLSARLYTLTELKAQLEKAGFSYRRCWGDFDGSPYGMDSPRLLALAERPRDERPARRTVVAPDDRLPRTVHIKGRR